jgi:hypothetical protein
MLITLGEENKLEAHCRMQSFSNGVGYKERYLWYVTPSSRVVAHYPRKLLILLARLLVLPEDGGDTFHRNVGSFKSHTSNI